MNLKLDYKKMLKRILTILSANRIIFSSLILLVIGGLVLLRINSLTELDVDEEHKAESLKSIKVVEFDQDSIDAINDLNQSSVDITSDFTDRNNPFVDN